MKVHFLITKLMVQEQISAVQKTYSLQVYIHGSEDSYPLWKRSSSQDLNITGINVYTKPSHRYDKKINEPLRTFQKSTF